MLKNPAKCLFACRMLLALKPGYRLAVHYSLSDMVPPWGVATKARWRFDKFGARWKVQSMGYFHWGCVSMGEMLETLNNMGVNIGWPGLVEQEVENWTSKEDVCSCPCGFSSSVFSGWPSNWCGESRSVMNMGTHCHWVTLEAHVPACGGKNGTTLEGHRDIILSNWTFFEWAFQAWP